MIVGQKREERRDTTNVNEKSFALFDGSDERSFDDVTCFDSHAVAIGQENSLPRIWFIGINNNNDEMIDKAYSNSNDNTSKRKNYNATSITATTVFAFEFQRLEFKEEAFDVELSGVNNIFYAKSVVVIHNLFVTPTQ